MVEKRKVRKVLYSEIIDDIRIVVGYVIYNKTNTHNIYTEFHKLHQVSIKALFNLTTEGTGIQIMCSINKKTDHIVITERFRKCSNTGIENNKTCSTYLGVHIAERILSHIYPNVERMPYGHSGYDFICGRGYMVDVKSATLSKNSVGWGFHIRNNTIADYFLCIAFDNREDLNPQHIWLIPGHIINNKESLYIAESTINKWYQYERSIDDIISCCNTLYGDNTDDGNK
jgi:hypothetical protein